MKRIEKIDGSRIYNYMMDFINIGWRRVGTEKAKNACKYIVKKFNEFGLEDVKLESFEMLLYKADKFSLTIKCDALPNKQTEIDCYPLWHTKKSEPEGTEADLIHIGYGTDKELRNCDIKGKIVVVDSFRMMNFYPTMDFWRVYEQARKKEAVGLVAIHDSPPGTLFVEYATRHQTLKDSNLESGNIPALVVGYESGRYIKSLLESEEKLEANLLLDSTIEPVMTENVYGVLPSKKPNDIILIGTHTDSWFDGAIDNAGGNAGMIEIADYYSQIPENDRKKTLVFAGFAGHEVGSLGAIQFARDHSAGLFDKISTFCMLDGFGSKGFLLESPTRGVIKTSLDEAKGLFTTDNQILYDYISDAVYKYNLFPSMHVSAVAGAFSDLGPFVAAKIPSFMIIGKGIFYHTIQDTADKVLPDQLERTTKAHIEIVDRIHKTNSENIRESDRKGVKANKKSISKDSEPIFFNFNITPNPMIKGTTALLYLTSYICKNKIIVDLKWNIKGKEIHSPIVPQRFGKVGQYEVILTLIDDSGNEYTTKKYAYVVDKK